MSLPITGTLINVATVVAGGTMGTVLGNRMPEKMRETVLHGLGLITLVVGISMAITTHNLLIPLFSILIGGMIGEGIDLDAALTRLGIWVEAKTRAIRPAPGAAEPAPDPREPAADRDLMVQGFITASLIFCIGPLAILGSVQDGLMGDYTLLAIKSLMDGFAAMALAASLGAGVLLSAFTVLGYQGGLSLLAMLFATALGGVSRTTPWVIEMTATGGVVILSISLLLLDLKRIRAANLLPAIFCAPLLVLLLGWLRISY